MKPNRKLAETRTPDGVVLTLHEHDGQYCIRLGGQELMNSMVTASELLLGELAFAPGTPPSHSRVLIGGLGLGFTLRSVLTRAGSNAAVQVAELIPEVVDWNRTFLAQLNGRLLADPRVEILQQDVWRIIAGAGRSGYDSILLDVDNGPTSMVQKRNARIYQPDGLKQIAAALKPGGRLAVWSACPEPAFAKRLAQAGFKVHSVPAKQHPTARRHAHMLYVADLPV